MIIGILLSYIVWCTRHRCLRNRNPPPQTTTKTKPKAETIEAVSTYQELDLTKMNKEDNYQSLIIKGNIGGNDSRNNDSTYTELNKVRDAEDNYQSLT